MVDLSGPAEPTINRTIQTVFNHLAPNQAAIASENATVADADQDSLIYSFSVAFRSNKPGDKLILSPDICGDSYAMKCSIKYVMQCVQLHCYLNT